MAKARCNLAPVLGADITAGCERDGAGGSRLTSANVIAGGKAYGMPGSARGEPARAVGACAAGKPSVRWHADVGGGTVRDTALLQGVQCQLRPSVARPVPQGSDACNPPANRWAVTLWRQFGVVQRDVSIPCRLPLTDSTDKQVTTHNNRQVQSQVMKRTRTLGCQPAIPKRQVFTTTTIQMIHQYTPCSDTII